MSTNYPDPPEPTDPNLPDTTPDENPDTEQPK